MLNIFLLQIILLIPSYSLWSRDTQTNQNDDFNRVLDSAFQTRTLTNILQTGSGSQLATKKVKSLRPPHLVVLSAQASEELIANAKIGNEKALKKLVKRVYWGAQENPFSLEEVLAIKDIHKKIWSSGAFYYWNIIFQVQGFSHFDSLVEKIKRYADSHENAHAQNIYGLIQSQTRSFLSFNSEEALKYWEKAAKNNFAPALVNLGNYLLSSSPERAVKLYQEAAQQKYLLGRLYLGHCYYNGKGVAEDKSKAITLYFSSNQPSIFSTIILSIGRKFIPAPLSQENLEMALQKILKQQKILSEKYDKSQRLTADALPTYPASKCLLRISKVFDDWIQILAVLIPALQKPEPGFMISNFEWRKSERKDVQFFVGFTHRGKDFLTIGEKNITILNMFIAHIKSYTDLQFCFTEFSKLFENNDGFVDDKIKKYEILAKTFNTMPIIELSVVERQELDHAKARVKIKLLAYNLMNSNFASTLQYLDTWQGLSKDLNEAIDFIIKQGRGERDKDFSDTYPYLNK